MIRNTFPIHIVSSLRDASSQSVDRKLASRVHGFPFCMASGIVSGTRFYHCSLSLALLEMRIAIAKLIRTLTILVSLRVRMCQSLIFLFLSLL